MNKQKYTLEDIKEAVIRKVKEIDEDFVIVEDGKYGLKFTKKGDKNFGMEIGLSNIEKEINMGDDFDAVINHRVKVFKETIDQMNSANNLNEWSFVKDKIIFVPSSKDYCKDLNNNMKKKNEDRDAKGTNDEIYTKGFIQDIVLAGAVDFPGFFAYITTNMVKEWKKTNDEVYDQICQNLMKYEAKYTVKRYYGILNILGGGSGILSPFLVKPKKLREIADKEGFEGKEIVGSIPFRDVIMLAEYNIANAMEIWRVGVTMIGDGSRPYPVSPKLFMIDKEGVISTFKTENFPTGIAIAVNSTTGKIETLPLDCKDDDMNLPSAISMEESIQSNPNIVKALGLLGKLSTGIPAKKFGEMVLEFSKNDKEFTKMMIEKMVKSGWIELRKVNNELMIFPSEKTIKMILKNGFGGKQKWD